VPDWFADEALWREIFPFEFGDAGALTIGRI
jgi:hypothetical protein